MIANTKLSSDRITKRIYPYYAGYSEKFVDSIISEIGIQKDQTILDPWNGSGTTTASAARHGIASIGVDLNPFMKAAATFRVAEVELIHSCVSKLVSLNSEKRGKRYAGALKAAKDYFYSSLENKDEKNEEYWVLIFIMGLSLRRVYRNTRSKNPAWYKEEIISNFSATKFKKELPILIEEIKEYLSVRGDFTIQNKPEFIVGNVVECDSLEKISHVITSPPYLTRIDYVKKSLPETVFASEVLGIDRNELRRKMTGSVLTTPVELSEIEALPVDVQEIIERVRSHPSKASDTYYYRFFANYFISMEKHLKKIDEMVEADGTLTFVTQPSYYKEIFVDLPSLISSMLARRGWGEKLATEHLARNSIVQLNTRTFASSQGVPAERSVIYRRV